MVREDVRLSRTAAGLLVLVAALLLMPVGIVVRQVVAQVMGGPSQPRLLVGADPLSDAVAATAAEFRVDESGAATYTIPLYGVPGTAGVMPQLSLTYSSQGGYGPLGKGWAISGMSSISRCRGTREAGDFLGAATPDGNPRPIAFGADDRYCLDGQRLLPSPETCPAAAGQSGVALATELDSFQRICAYASGANGPAYFTAERKDGSMSWYGNRDQHASANRPDGYFETTSPINPAAALSWAQTRFQDSTGNYIDYLYLENPAGAGTGEHLLSEVRYTGKLVLPGQSGSPSAPYARIVFNYSARPAQQWGKSYASGGVLTQSRRLDSITSCATIACATQDQARHYLLTYQPSASGASLDTLIGLQECRDSTGAVCGSPTAFSSSAGKHEFASSERPADLQVNIGDFKGFKLGDVNGDGLPDFVYLKTGGTCGASEQVVVALGRLNAAGTPGFSNGRVVCTPASIRDRGDGAWHLFDYDGDGRDDLFLSAALGQPWRIYLSDGEGFNTAQNPISALSPAVPSTNGANDQVQLADLNGDGLTDILYPRANALRARVMERQAGGFGWGAERTIAVDESSIGPISGCSAFPTAASCIVTIGGVPTPKTGFMQMTDFNGDAASDMLIKVTTLVQSPIDGCLTGMAPGASRIAPKSASASDSSLVVLPYVEASAGDQAQAMSGCGQWTSYEYVHAFTVQSMTSTTVALTNYDLISVLGELTDVAFADANGDGLSDVFFRSNTGKWVYRLNTGRGFHAYVQLPMTEFLRQTRFVDVNGDGRADVLHPFNGGSFKAYNVRYALPSGGYGPETWLPGVPGRHANALLCQTNGCDADRFVPLFSDFDGDGNVDFMSIRMDDNPDLFVSRSAAAGRYVPRDVITGITNGLGARTEIAYAPLTNKDVYRRASGTRNVVNWGRGAPVMDLMAPTYVVARASSSSPQAGNPAAMATVHYRYANGRVQAGGRGFLGFETVETIDPNQTGGHVVTTTRYAQHFPFIGMPTRTTRAVVTGAYTVPACLSGGMTNACFSLPGQAHAALGGSWFSDSQQAWEYAPNSLAAQAPLHVRTLGSEEALRDPFTGAQTSRVNTAFAYGSHGNVTQTIVDTFTGSETTPTGTVITASSYADNAARWRLGRLASTTVTHRRAGQPDVVRTSAFGYQMSGAVTGQLNEERVQPGGAADLASTKAYQLDHYGNRLMSVTCAAPATGCDVNGFQFHPNTPQQVKRYARVEYDAWGRFPVATFEPFWTVGGGEERLTSRVLGRNVFGDAVDAVDANNVRSFAVKGAMGRDYYAWTQTTEGAGPGNGGVTSLTTYRWCTQVACPAGAKFRQQISTTGAPRQWTYFDVLGRPLMQAAETFNVGIAGQDVSATCTDYDIAGKPKRASHPFFLPGTAGPDGPAAIEGICAAPARLWTVTTYDALGRPVLVTAPDGSQASQGYAGLTTSATDPRGNTTTQRRNGKGELVATTDAAGLSTYYAYAADGNLLTVSRNVGGGNIVNGFQYDALGRKVQQSDPDTGITTFQYNALGELVAQIDNLGQRIEHDIDGRGRIWRTRAKGVDGMTESESTFVFDIGNYALGKLTSEEVTGQYTAWSGQANTALNTRRNLYYDALGRVYGGVIEVDEHVLGFNTFYDAWGRVRLERDVSGRGTKSQYGTRGHLVATCDVELTGGDQPGTPCATGTDTHRRILQTDAWGNVVREGRGDNAALEITRTYWPLTGRLATLCAGGSQCNLVNEGYGWDAAGNLSSHLKEQRYLESFSYDSLNRLVEGKLLMRDGVTVNQSTLVNGYDALGNICSKNGLGYGYAGASGCSGPSAQASMPTSMSPSAVSASASLAAIIPTASSPSRTERALGSGRNAANRLSHVPAAWRDIGVRHAPDLRSRRYSSDGGRARENHADDDRPSWERDDEDWELAHGFVGPAFWSRSGGSAKQGTAVAATAALPPGAMPSGTSNTGTGATTGIQSLVLGSGSPHAVAQTGTGAGATTYGYDTRGNQVFRDAPGTVNDRTIRYSVDDKAHEILMGSGQRVRFWYGADGQRYKREDAGKVTYYIGGLEMIVQGGAMTFKRYASGVALQVVSSGIVHSTKFLFQDHLGSLVRIANPDGTLAERLDYSAFGDRRNPTNPTSSGTASIHTPRGFTGHEYVDGTGVIHMNGRIYDQELGRFLQPDPVIQAPDNAQSWNAYTYVFNNPLAYTDPSGNISLRQALGIAIAVVGTVFAPHLTQVWMKIGYAALIGAASGYVSTGTLRGAVQGAFTAGVTMGVGLHTQGWSPLGQIGAQAVTGGVMESLRGGNFGNGFVAAGLTAATMPNLRIRNDVVRTTVGALVGGSISKVTGGKFANGAISGAVQAAMMGSRKLRQSSQDSKAKWAGVSGNFDDAPEDLKGMLQDPKQRETALREVSRRLGYGDRSDRIEYVDSPQYRRLPSGRYYGTDTIATVSKGFFGRYKIIFYSSAFDPGEYGALASVIDHEQFHLAVALGGHQLHIYDNELAAIDYQRSRPSWGIASEGFKNAIGRYEETMLYCKEGGISVHC